MIQRKKICWLNRNWQLQIVHKQKFQIHFQIVTLSNFARNRLCIFFSTLTKKKVLSLLQTDEKKTPG